MNSARDVASSPDSANRTQASPSPLASWYTPGLSDGLGDRLLMFDNKGTSSLELLRVRPEFAGAPGFERALRESVERLLHLNHPTFGQAHAVEFLEGDEGLALVSTHTAGKRLSEMFQGRQPRGGMHPAFVTWLVRQLTPALFDFQAQGRGLAHGALTAERIVLTPEGHLIIVEHVLGAALGQLRLSARQLWEDLGVVATPAAGGVPSLDARADLTQLGLVALSVLLGRRVTPAEYPSRLPRLLDEFADQASRRSPSLVPPLRRWLERVLRTDGSGFDTTADACEGLRELPGPTGRQAFERLHAGRHQPAVATAPLPPVHEPAFAPGSAAMASAAMPPADATSDDVLLSYRPEPEPLEMRPASTMVDEGFIAPRLTVPRPVPVPPSAPVQQTSVDEPLVMPSVRSRPAPAVRLPSAQTLAVVFGVVAAIEGAVIAWLATAPAIQAGVPATAAVPVTIDSAVPGDIVMVDGHQVGTTPFQLSLDQSMRSVRVYSLDRLREPAPAAAEAAPPAAAQAARTAAILAQAANRPRSGGLRISSPIEVQVLEGDRVLGSSVDGPVVISAGVHQLDLVNAALGYRARQTVEIKAGEIVPLAVKPPDGRLSINALPWAQVSIDGTPVGETPLANLSVAAGPHEIVFRHPQLGEKRETIVVRAGAASRVSATLGR